MSIIGKKNEAKKGYEAFQQRHQTQKQSTPFRMPDPSKWTYKNPSISPSLQERKVAPIVVPPQASQPQSVANASYEPSQVNDFSKLISAHLFYEGLVGIQKIISNPNLKLSDQQRALSKLERENKDIFNELCFYVYEAYKNREPTGDDFGKKKLMKSPLILLQMRNSSNQNVLEQLIAHYKKKESLQREINKLSDFRSKASNLQTSLDVLRNDFNNLDPQLSVNYLCKRIWEADEGCRQEQFGKDHYGYNKALSNPRWLLGYKPPQPNSAIVSPLNELIVSLENLTRSNISVTNTSTELLKENDNARVANNLERVRELTDFHNALKDPNKNSQELIDKFHGLTLKSQNALCFYVWIAGGCKNVYDYGQKMIENDLNKAPRSSILMHLKNAKGENLIEQLILHAHAKATAERHLIALEPFAASLKDSSKSAQAKRDEFNALDRKTQDLLNFRIWDFNRGTTPADVFQRGNMTYGKDQILQNPDTLLRKNGEHTLIDEVINALRKSTHNRLSDAINLTKQMIDQKLQAPTANIGYARLNTQPSELPVDKNITFITAEYQGLASVGGLAPAVYGMTEAMTTIGNKVRLIMPKYEKLPKNILPLTKEDAIQTRDAVYGLLGKEVRQQILHKWDWESNERQMIQHLGDELQKIILNASFNPDAIAPLKAEIQNFFDVILNPLLARPEKNHTSLTNAKMQLNALTKNRLKEKTHYKTKEGTKEELHLNDCFGEGKINKVFKLKFNSGNQPQDKKEFNEIFKGFSGNVENISFYFIEDTAKDNSAQHNNHFSGTPYSKTGPYPHELLERFAYFSASAAELASTLKTDVIHAHDWHTAAVPALLNKKGNTTPSVFTFHNNLEQGKYEDDYGMQIVEKMGLEKRPTNMMVEALQHATQVTTVSKTFAEESQSELLGEKIHDEVRKIASLSNKLTGIVNGANVSSYDPSTDAHLKNLRDPLDPFSPIKKDYSYSANDLLIVEKKKKISEDLALELALHHPEIKLDLSQPIVLFVGRYDAKQKGLEMFEHALDVAVANKAQLVIMGVTSDDPKDPAIKILDDLENKAKAMGAGVFVVRDKKRENDGRLKFQHGFNPTTNPEELSKEDLFGMQGIGSRFRAIADIVLVPSKFEPCGLVQLEAYLYGGFPFARKVGGLIDTVMSLSLEGAINDGKIDEALYELNGVVTGHLYEAKDDPNSQEQIEIFKRDLDKFIKFIRLLKSKPDAHREMMQKNMKFGQKAGWLDSFNGELPAIEQMLHVYGAALNQAKQQDRIMFPTHLLNPNELGRV